MSKESTDEGVIQAVLENFTKHELPRLLKIDEHVEGGGTLNEADIVFLGEVLERARKLQGLVDRHPEYSELHARAVHLYERITERALANEKGD